MALPTTRRLRYVHRQRKYRRRIERANQNRRRVIGYIGGVPVFKRAADWTLKGDGRKQLPPGLKPERGNGPALPLFGTFLHRHPYPATRFVPPRVEVHNPFHVRAFAGNYHPRQGIAQFWIRRVKWRGRKLNPITDGKRRPRAIRYADRFFSLNGWYPAWDPLQRHPNELDG